MKNCLPVIIACLALHANAESDWRVPSFEKTSVTISVLDERGLPVEGAAVSTSGYRPENIEAVADTNGQAVLEVPKDQSLQLYVFHEGYYRSGGSLFQGGKIRNPEGPGLMPKPMPAAFTVQLNRIVNPVFLHHRIIRQTAPRTSESIGFDFTVGDWVDPFGMGKVNDLYFTFHDVTYGADGYAARLEVTFPSPSDGIQEVEGPSRSRPLDFASDLKLMHRAKVDGYLPKWTKEMRALAGQPRIGSHDVDRHYLLRTRSQSDPQGHLLKACYAWIKGGINFDISRQGVPQVTFEYYFNPDVDPEARSLEYILWSKETP